MSSNLVQTYWLRSKNSPSSSFQILSFARSISKSNGFCIGFIHGSTYLISIIVEAVCEHSLAHHSQSQRSYTQYFSNHCHYLLRCLYLYCIMNYGICQSSEYTKELHFLFAELCISPKSRQVAAAHEKKVCL